MELSVNKLSDIVDNGLCVGCGICQSIAGSDKIKIAMSPKGRLEPKETNKISPDIFEKIKSIKEQEEKEIQESVPNWFIMMPKANEKVIYVRGTAVVDTMQGSIDSATNAALRDLAKKLETRLAAKVNETVVQAGIGEDISTTSEIIKVTTLVVEEVTIVGYELSKNKIFKMDNGKYRTFILLEYPVANLYKAFINRLENNKAMQKQLDEIKNTETYKELEAYVVEFTGA